MIPAFVFAASLASTFLDDFTGTWLCGEQKTVWNIQPWRDRWAQVTYGDPEHPYGVAYVGFLEADNVISYNDFHADGALARLTSPPPTNHIYHWSGAYYPLGKPKDTSGDIYWTLTPSGTLHRDFGQIVDGKRKALAADECVKQ
jgi:hypothetical protein